MSSTTTTTMLARIASPVASPTDCGPPETFKPYQQWISAIGEREDQDLDHRQHDVAALDERREVVVVLPR